MTTNRLIVAMFTGGLLLIAAGGCVDMGPASEGNDAVISTGGDADTSDPSNDADDPADSDGGPPTDDDSKPDGQTDDGGEATGDPSVDPSTATHVLFETTLGDIRIELDRANAPGTVENFVQYLAEGFYDGQDGLGPTIFHRVIPGFVIQGGGFTSDLAQKTTRDPITNEAMNTTSNIRGTISMAQTGELNSGTSQFFINLVDNTNLDYTETFQGHAVFGTVVEGMDVADAIAAVATATFGAFSDVPVEPVIIITATLQTEAP